MEDGQTGFCANNVIETSFCLCPTTQALHRKGTLLPRFRSPIVHQLVKAADQRKRYRMRFGLQLTGKQIVLYLSTDNAITCEKEENRTMKWGFDL